MRFTIYFFDTCQIYDEGYYYVVVYITLIGLCEGV